MLSTKNIEEIRDRIAQALNPKEIYLFGSYASGEAHEDSDVDLLIIMDSPLNPHQRNLQIRRLFPRRNFSLDAFVYTPEEALKYKDIPGTLLHNAYLNGKLIYG
jgi:uncharacterized protein